MPRTVGGLWEVVADGKWERAVHNIAMIRQGRMRLMSHHYHHARARPKRILGHETDSIGIPLSGGLARIASRRLV